MENQDLKPCPFCGTKVEVKKVRPLHSIEIKFHVEHYCDSTKHFKNMYTAYYDTEQEAVDGWNIRT